MMTIDFDNPGLPRKKFIRLMDELWTTGQIQGDPGIMEELSEEQGKIIREIKLCIKRNK